MYWSLSFSHQPEGAVRRLWISVSSRQLKKPTRHWSATDVLDEWDTIIAPCIDLEIHGPKRKVDAKVWRFYVRWRKAANVRPQYTIRMTRRQITHPPHKAIAESPLYTFAEAFDLWRTHVQFALTGEIPPCPDSE